MRELTVRLRFVKHCLGQVRKFTWRDGRRRNYFLLPRSPTGKIVFMPSWWQSVLVKSAEVLCRHQEAVKGIRFGLEVEGTPPEAFYRHYTAPNRFSVHEAFWPGDEIVVTCVIPSSISEVDFKALMQIAGKYFGISPAYPYEHGFFTVQGVKPVERLIEQENA